MWAGSGLTAHGSARTWKATFLVLLESLYEPSKPEGDIFHLNDREKIRDVIIKTGFTRK
jgi:hypothetical protein